MSLSLKIIPTQLLEEFKAAVDDSVENSFEKLHESSLSVGDFSFYTSVSAVFSSKIEGEDIELDSYLKHKTLGVQYQPDYTQKIDDLYNAYEFAKVNAISADRLMQAHTLLTKNILQPSQQGKFRTGNMFVMTNDGRIEYVATEPDKVSAEMEKFYTDLNSLLDAELDFKEVFFFASLLHLVFVKIHPLNDGNGRTARLLEKWFLAEKLGYKAWFIESESNYYDNHQTYYNNIRRLGLEYDDLEYTKALPFLLMLQSSVK
ncbi:Fic family protein [Flavobacterium sp. DG1-102-2]|uniref:Fic family protein n=1 Tax=Flavobacterium sp. DG1-102-2 TaxID=3081663 RepID=UPI0029492886|nr:Fic family protein [Flavobacterium sp. DG1-102-2]MDV6169914.1 Fic family protein [Flavobacterium sp. DG1-102-2]